MPLQRRPGAGRKTEHCYLFKFLRFPKFSEKWNIQRQWIGRNHIKTEGKFLALSAEKRQGLCLPSLQNQETIVLMPSIGLLCDERRYYPLLLRQREAVAEQKRSRRLLSTHSVSLPQNRPFQNKQAQVTNAITWEIQLLLFHVQAFL